MLRLPTSYIHFIVNEFYIWDWQKKMKENSIIADVASYSGKY